MEQYLHFVGKDKHCINIAAENLKLNQRQILQSIGLNFSIHAPLNPTRFSMAHLLAFLFVFNISHFAPFLLDRLSSAFMLLFSQWI